MSKPSKNFADKIDAHMAQSHQHDHRIAHIYRRLLHILEMVIAAVTIVVLIVALCFEVYDMFCVPDYFADVEHVEEFLNHILTIVVGLEFVRMLIDTTPANILEVLTVAITRHVVLSHDDYWSNLACVACIAGLFAIRRYLIRRHELKEEMIDEE